MKGNVALLWPVVALATWTLCVLLLMAFRRVRAALFGRVGPGEYAFGESVNVPAEIALPNRNYMNLLELPILFYVACILAYVIEVGSYSFVILAWPYVALRIVHSLVHMTYNQVTHRLAVFAASNLALIGLWVLLAKRIAMGGAA